MHRISPILAALLADLRQRPGFPELLKAIEAPQLPRFKISQAQEAEKARATWIFQSGRRDQHEKWLTLLTGEPQKETDE